MNSLTFRQLREDLDALPALSPYTPTNVIRVSSQCGEVVMEFDDSEEQQLREELDDARSHQESAEKAVKEAEARVDELTAEVDRLNKELGAIHDGEESVATYRKRALVVEKTVEQCRGYLQDARRVFNESQAELKALRARKGVAPAVVRHSSDLLSLLHAVAGKPGEFQQRARHLQETMRATIERPARVAVGLTHPPQS